MSTETKLRRTGKRTDNALKPRPDDDAYAWIMNRSGRSPWRQPNYYTYMMLKAFIHQCERNKLTDQQILDLMMEARQQ